MADMERIRNGSPVDMVEAEKWTWMRYAGHALTRAETEGRASIARPTRHWASASLPGEHDEAEENRRGRRES